MTKSTFNLLQKEIPTNRWLVKDHQIEIIRTTSPDVANPKALTENELQTIQRLIDFVRYSQDAKLNNEENEDYLRPAVGLAAPQIGVNQNMFFVRFEHPMGEETTIEEFAMINPHIVSKSTQIAVLEGGEGCLSVDEDREGLVPRHYKIIVEGYDWLTNEQVTLTLRGYLAIVFQHELDHNIGKLYYDAIDPNPEAANTPNPEWILL